MLTGLTNISDIKAFEYRDGVKLSLIHIFHEKLQIYKEKSQRESESGKETRKRDFGLE